MKSFDVHKYLWHLNSLHLHIHTDTDCRFKMYSFSITTKMINIVNNFLIMYANLYL